MRFHCSNGLVAMRNYAVAQLRANIAYYCHELAKTIPTPTRE